MIPKHVEGRILRLFLAEKWPISTIAREVGHHHTTVRRVLAVAGVPEAQLPARSSKVDAYLGFIRETIERYPRITASRLFAMVQERGYDGRPDHFRHMMSRLRPRRTPEAYLRLRTLPGEQAQVDWAHFGRVLVGRALRALVCFVMVLAFSRRLFFRFGFDQGMSGFLRGHQAAFEAFGGVPRVALYDNLKSAVLERVGDAIRFHPTLLSFAAHYRYEPRPVAVARGNEKGRVERAIRYIRDAFFVGRTWSGLDDLNDQAHTWATGPASDRRLPDDPTLTVRTAFEQERALLLPLPDDRFPVDERREVHAGKTPYVRFDSNDYSVPHTHVGKTLCVLASERDVRVLDATVEVACHGRSYDRGARIEDPAHIEALAEEKHAARLSRAQDRLVSSAPRASDLLLLLAERGHNLGSATAALVRLLDHYGAAELALAIDEALRRDAPHPGSVRQVLERRRHERGLTPPVAVVLSEAARAKDRPVHPHALSDYERIAPSDPEESSHE